MIKISNPIPKSFFIYITIILVCLSVFLAPSNESAKASIYQPKAELPSDVFFISKNIESSSQNSQTSSQISISSKVETGDKTSNVLGEIKANAEVQPEKVVAITKINKGSKYLAKQFGSKIGQKHMDQCNSTLAGRKFLEAFKSEGEDKQLIACAVLNNENGSHDLETRGVCSLKFMENGDYRRCVYSNINSAGIDLGLFQINSFYQAKRITKLAGPEYACTFQNSKDWADPCNKKKAEWLFNIDNQLLIIKDIYKEQGFTPWVAYNKNVKPYL